MELELEKLHDARYIITLVNDSEIEITIEGGGVAVEIHNASGSVVGECTATACELE